MAVSVWLQFNKELLKPLDGASWAFVFHFASEA